MSKPRGYRKTATGFRAWVRRKSIRDDFNELKTKRFHGTPTPAELRAWRATAKDELQAMLTARRRARAAIVDAPSSGFRHDAIYRYLPAVQAMPTYEQRVRDIMQWVDEFGDRDRHGIQPYEIRAVRDRWLTVGPKLIRKTINGASQLVAVAEPLAASTVNHRLRALSNLYTVLDGKRAKNPVRDDVPEADEPHGIPRSLDYDTLRQIIDAMPERGRGDKGHARPTFSSAKLCVRCLAWSGIMPKELHAIIKAERATPGSAIHRDDALIVVPPRRKGHGAPGRIVPLGPEGMAAFGELVSKIEHVRFDTRGTLRAWHAASKAVLGHTVRLYDLRHSFVTAVTKATKDLRLAGKLAGHVKASTTDRYAMAALLPTLRAGIESTFPDKEPKQ